MSEQVTARQMNRLRQLHVESAPEFQPECADPRCEQLWPCDMSKVIATYDALRESHAELKRLLGTVLTALDDSRQRYGGTPTRRWLGFTYEEHAAFRAAIEKAEAING